MSAEFGGRAGFRRPREVRECGALRCLLRRRRCQCRGGRAGERQSAEQAVNSSGHRLPSSSASLQSSFRLVRIVCGWRGLYSDAAPSAVVSLSTQEVHGRAERDALDASSLRQLYNLTVTQLMGYAMATSDRLDSTFAALADPTRRAILARLASGEASVLELAEPFEMTQPAISKHLKVLERAGLISRGRDAQRRPCRLEARPLAEANDWLKDYRRLWETSFRKLDAVLRELKSSQAKRAASKRKRR
jgi:DNA-binding transcriptional ArsR family regulator